MSAGKPLVSVIIPSYNAAQFLREAVASVRAQEYSPIEIVVVDDGSTDNTAEMIRSLGEGVRYVRQAMRRQRRATAVWARRAGSGSRLDADDLGRGQTERARRAAGG